MDHDAYCLSVFIVAGGLCVDLVSLAGSAGLNKLKLKIDAESVAEYSVSREAHCS